MDYVYSSTIYVIAKVGGLDNAFTEVDLPSYGGILSPVEDERIYCKYGDCAIPFMIELYPL